MKDCNPSTGEVEAAEAEAHSQPGLQNEFKASLENWEMYTLFPFFFFKKENQQDGWLACHQTILESNTQNQVVQGRANFHKLSSDLHNHTVACVGLTNKYGALA